MNRLSWKTKYMGNMINAKTTAVAGVMQATAKFLSTFLIFSSPKVIDRFPGPYPGQLISWSSPWRQ